MICAIWGFYSSKNVDVDLVCGLVLNTVLEKHPVFILRVFSCLLYFFSFVRMLYFLVLQREKMARLTNYVPVVRRTLEALIFRVKGMLVANNSADAFWMGNLKNKTIKGEEILTQVGILFKVFVLCLSKYCHLVQPRTIQK